MADRRLQEYERIAKAVEHVYNLCDDDRKKLIRLKYWKPQLKSFKLLGKSLGGDEWYSRGDTYATMNKGMI